MNAWMLAVGLVLQTPPAPPAYEAGAPAPTPTPAAVTNGGYCQEAYGFYSDANSSTSWADPTICGSCCVKYGGCSVKPIGDMYQHFPYTQFPKTYYYFRPYNHLHVREKAAQAESLGANPKAPYSNALFRDVYQTVEARFAPAAQ